jgi:NOL1/NOP2/fmu family ribosome biogenesis protein
MKGNIFQPDHALALARKARQQLPLALPDVYRYLHGEVLNIPEYFTGWVAPTFDGWQLGWGKAVQGQLKNHYPKGLRK